jgi:hypothetical protein
MARHARDRDRGRDADEDQQRRHQEAAADAEHARNESDREPHEEDQQDIDGQFGDRKVDLHEQDPPMRGPLPSVPQRSGGDGRA